MSEKSSGGHEPPPINHNDKGIDKQSDMDTSDSEQIKNSSFINVSNKYRSSDLGPFMVYVEHNNKNTADEGKRNIGRLFPIKVGHFLQACDNFRNNIIDIKSIGYNRVKVVLKTFSSANELVNHKLITENNLIAFIPTFFTQKKGLIRMVDTFFSEDYLKQSIVSDIKVTDVKRMKKKTVDKDGNPLIVDRQAIIVSFLGSTIPNRVIINSVIFPVEQYVYPVVQCYGCLHYGHTAKLCKAKQRCKKCGIIVTENHECEVQTFCIHCKSTAHLSISRKCPVYSQQLKIKKIMSTENVSFKEAEQLANSPSYAKITTSNRFSILSDYNNSFPNLPNVSADQSSTNFVPKPRTPPHSLSQPPFKKIRSSYNRSVPTTSSQPNTRVEAPTSNKTKPIIPNPYREDFQSYKNELAEKLSSFFIDTIKKFAPLAIIGSSQEESLKNEISLICGSSSHKSIAQHASNT